ncbi:hypothetical protein [Vibrio parahaemolyticus]|uniref:hypothetical protein n=1 Tax=Vibrio parahaemolyticus TaxID=670 RepID=UPI00235EC84B|nr:hypothetical protein [Vibrio parahaemolyticus]
MNEEDQYVECCTHGKQQVTYVCQHVVKSLRDGKPRGFWSAEPEPGNERPDSWCSACEDKVNSDGGEWNDESEAFAGVTLLCGACYDRAKEMNVKN